MPTFKSMTEVMDYEKEEKRKNKQASYAWTSLANSQHTFLANLIGLNLTALVIFASIFKSSLTDFSKYLVSFSVGLTFIQVLCLIFMSHHERQNAYGNNSIIRNFFEVWIRGIMFFALAIAWLATSVLIIISCWK